MQGISLYRFSGSNFDLLMEITTISPSGYNLSRNKEVDQTKKSMAEGLSELLTVKKLWSTVVLVRFRNCF